VCAAEEEVTLELLLFRLKSKALLVSFKFYVSCNQCSVGNENVNH
jgi:hypothetical protein